jgi:hypothetical protein
LAACSGYLFAGNGMGGILLLVLLAVGAVLLFRMFARRGAQSPQPIQYAGMNQGTTGGAAARGSARRGDALGGAVPWRL